MPFFCVRLRGGVGDCMSTSLDSLSQPVAEPPQSSRKPRGFAAMDPDKQKQIASLGGKAAHERGRAREFTSQEAREAGRKGGQRVSQDRAHMSRIGARGGRARARRWQAQDARSNASMEPETQRHE